METTESEKTPSPGAPGGREHALGHSDPELERLSAQARLLDPFTRALFRHAGVRGRDARARPGAATAT